VFFPLPKLFTRISLRVMCHHQIIVLVKSVIGRVESEWESRLCIFVGHPVLLIFGKDIIQCLKESTDLVLICIGTRANYDGFAIIEGRACCRFILC